MIDAFDELNNLNLIFPFVSYENILFENNSFYLDNLNRI